MNRTRIATVVIGALLVALCVVRGTGAIRSDDAWLHLAAGRAIVAHGGLPASDVFLHDAGAPWLIHSWLAELIFYGVERAGGLALVGALRALLLAATFVVLLVLLRRRGAPPWLAGGLAVAAFLVPGIRATLLRPLLFTHLFVAVFLLVIFAARKRALWALPAVMVVWANLHAGHMIGIALAGLLPVALTIDRIRVRGRDATLDARSAWIAFAAVVAASLVNPNGPRVWAYAVGLASPAAGQGTVWEWVGADVARYPWVFALIALAWVVTLPRVRRVGTLDALLLGLATALPLIAIRFLVHAAIIAAVVAGRGAIEGWAARQAKRRRSAPSRRPIATVVATIAIAASIAVVAGRGVARGEAFSVAPDRTFFPVRAVAFMKRAGVDGKLLNLREWGGYLLWHRPGRRVFIDGRIAVSAGSVLADYAAVAEAHRGFGHVLDRRRIDVVLTSYEVMRTGPAAAEQLIAYDPAWRLIYFDDVALVYARDTASQRALIDRHGFRTLVPASRARPFRARARVAAAEAEARRAAQRSPSVRSLTYAGLLALRRKAAREAEGFFRRAVALDRTSARNHNNLGVALMRQRRVRAARRVFVRVLELDPGHEEARRNIELLDRVR